MIQLVERPELTQVQDAFLECTADAGLPSTATAPTTIMGATLRELAELVRRMRSGTASAGDDERADSIVRSVLAEPAPAPERDRPTKHATPAS